MYTLVDSPNLLKEKEILIFGVVLIKSKTAIITLI